MSYPTLNRFPIKRCSVLYDLTPFILNLLTILSKRVNVTQGISGICLNKGILFK